MPPTCRNVVASCVTDTPLWTMCIHGVYKHVYEGRAQCKMKSSVFWKHCQYHFLCSYPWAHISPHYSSTQFTMRSLEEFPLNHFASICCLLWFNTETNKMQSLRKSSRLSQSCLPNRLILQLDLLARPRPSIPKAGSLQPSPCRVPGAHQEHSSMLQPAASPAQLCSGHVLANKTSKQNTLQCNPPAFSTHFIWHLVGRREASAQWKQHHP